jgi:cytochrome b involved in lipid metabolism
MHEKILFGIIGVLLFSIAGLGTYQAVKHPAETMELAPEAVSVVGEAVSDTASSLSQITQQAPQAQASTPTISSDSSVRREDRREDRHEEEDEDESDDDSRQTGTAPVATQKPASSPAPAATTGVKTFTMAEIATHNSAANCYSAISGSVYNLTSFVSRHPGGQGAIKSLCGTDGTSAYNGQHGGQGRPTSELASLKIGVLAL